MHRSTSAALAFSAPAADQPFAIMYTSGTTGRPKGVLLSHRMLRLCGEAVALASGAGEGDVLYLWEPMFHIGGAQMLVLPLLRNVTLAMAERFSASRFWVDASAMGTTHIHYLGGKPIHRATGIDPEILKPVTSEILDCVKHSCFDNFQTHVLPPETASKSPLRSQSVIPPPQ